MDKQLIIAGWSEYEGDDRERAIGYILGVGPDTRKAGCIDFLVGADVSDPHRTITFERWPSIETHDEHLRQGYMETFRANMGALRRRDRQFRQFLAMEL